MINTRWIHPLPAPSTRLHLTGGGTNANRNRVRQTIPEAQTLPEQALWAKQLFGPAESIHGFEGAFRGHRREFERAGWLNPIAKPVVLMLS